MRRHPPSIAFVVRDPLPPLRADVLTLFGAEMPRHGIATELVGQRGSGGGQGAWGAGAAHIVGRLGGRLAGVATPLWDAFGLARAWRHAPLDAIQVRDKIASGLVARCAAALLNLPFVYWMSFPMVEAYEARRDQLRSDGRRIAWLAHAARAALSRLVLYRLLLPQAHHLFVQSEAMADWLSDQGIGRSRMTAVPMGVDTARFERAAVTPAPDVRLDGRRVLVYLGRVARARQSDFLLEVVQLLRVRTPSLLLVIAGDAASGDEMAWMRACIAARGLQEHVLLTGWLPQPQALGYAVRAEIGLSPIPRGALFDVSSPTKLVEYMALGIASVANDIPDQAQLLGASGAGLLAPMQAQQFSGAVQMLLDDAALRQRCAARGPDYVRAHRSYGVIAGMVAAAYARLLPDDVHGARR